MNKEKSYKILISEDEAINAMCLQLELESKGFTVETCASGEDVLKILEKDKFDMVLMDIGLAGKLDGIETVVEMKKKSHDIPVIFITGYAGTEIQKRAENLTPYAFLKKPYQKIQIISLIQKYFEEKTS